MERVIGYTREGYTKVTLQNGLAEDVWNKSEERMKKEEDEDERQEAEKMKAAGRSGFKIRTKKYRPVGS